MTLKKYRIKRQLVGKCSNCGKRPLKKGCTCCVWCLTQKSLTQIDLRLERRERGKCPECGRQRNIRAGRAKTWACYVCLKRRREATRRYRAKLRAARNGV